jgi:hypothetical protein
MHAEARLAEQQRRGSLDVRRDRSARARRREPNG